METKRTVICPRDQRGRNVRWRVLSSKNVSAPFFLPSRHGKQSFVSFDSSKNQFRSVLKPILFTARFGNFCNQDKMVACFYRPPAGDTPRWLVVCKKKKKRVRSVHSVYPFSPPFIYPRLLKQTPHGHGTCLSISSRSALSRFARRRGSLFPRTTFLFLPFFPFENR